MYWYHIYVEGKIIDKVNLNSDTLYYGGFMVLIHKGR